MEKSVLIEVVRSLDKKEVRELNKWLQSPAHNQREDTLRLFVFLNKFQAKNEVPPSKEIAWKAIFPSQPYDDAYMRQVMFFLLKAIEEYFVFSECINNKHKFEVTLVQVYRKRSLEKAYRQMSRIARDSLENQPLRDVFYLQNKFMLEQEEFEHRVRIRTSLNEPFNLQETSDALEKWFIAEKLQTENAMFSHRNVSRTANYNTGLLKEILPYVEQRDWTKETAIATMYYVYMAMSNPSEEHYFDQLEHLIHSHEQTFTDSNFRTVYFLAINYCVAKVNQGRSDFSIRAFKLYKNGIENGFLFEKNMLTRYTFGNAVAFAIKTGEFVWAENLIEKYQTYLEEKERKSIVNFNLSRVYFEKGDYKKAHKLLVQFEYDDLLFNLIAKTMLLKIYYETDEYDALESLIDSMRIYLQRKESLDANRKASYKNLLSVMKKLLQVNILSRSEREKFREVVVSTNPLAERDWLLKQLEGRK